MRIMYDAATIGVDYPSDAQMLAGYIDGNYQTYADQVARYPNLIHIPIAVWPSTNNGICLDVETGDATPDQAPAWVTMRRNAGIVAPWVYCSYAVWQDVINAFVNQSTEPPLYWIAAYPGIGAEIYPGSIGHQYGGTDPWDVSVMLDVIPGIDSTPPTPPHPPTPEELSVLPAFIATYPCKAGPAAMLFCEHPTTGKKTMHWLSGAPYKDVDAAVAAGAINSIATSVSDNFVAGYNIVGADPRK